MEAWRGRVEADIAGHHLARGEGVEPGRVGRLVDIAALVEQAEQGRSVGAHRGAAPSMEEFAWERTGLCRIRTFRRARCGGSRSSGSRPATRCACATASTGTRIW